MEERGRAVIAFLSDLVLLLVCLFAVAVAVRVIGQWSRDLWRELR